MDVNKEYAREAQQSLLDFFCAFIRITFDRELETRIAVRLATTTFFTHYVISPSFP